MHFEELNNQTRTFMLQEFELEQTGPLPYRSKSLSMKGQSAFVDQMRQAIRAGNEQTLGAALAQPQYWHPTENYQSKGVVRQRRLNVNQAAERLAVTEFNTWYIRGLAKRLLIESVTYCQAYRAALPRGKEYPECSQHEGRIFFVRDIYQAHRVRYWPEPGNSTAFSLPFGPGCRHTIRRYYA